MVEGLFVDVVAGRRREADADDAATTADVPMGHILWGAAAAGTPDRGPAIRQGFGAAKSHSAIPFCLGVLGEYII